MPEATLEDLIRFLSQLFEDGGEPVFTYVDQLGDPHENTSMRDLWRKVTGKGGTPPPGAWRHCPSCSRWYVDSLLT